MAQDIIIAFYKFCILYINLVTWGSESFAGTNFSVFCVFGGLFAKVNSAKCFKLAYKPPKYIPANYLTLTKHQRFPEAPYGNYTTLRKDRKKRRKITRHLQKLSRKMFFLLTHPPRELIPFNHENFRVFSSSRIFFPAKVSDLLK